MANLGGRQDSGGASGSGPASAEDVEKFHQNADVDTRREALHHTLGSAPNQAAPGDHTHRGGDSSPLLSGVVIAGSRQGNPALASMLAALVALGAEDATTP